MKSNAMGWIGGVRRAAASVTAWGLLAPFAMVAIPASSALAQVQATEPYWAVVQNDKTPLRCYYTDTSYTVGELPKGFLVRVDGEGAVYARVHYPAKMTAFVVADQAKVENGVAKLGQASKLRAASTIAGFDGSWKALLDTALPAGAELKWVENITNKDGVVTAYRVQAPEAARGYVPMAAIRKATDAEAAAAGAQAPLATAPKPATPPAAPATTPGATPVGTGAPAAPAIDLTQPQQPTGQPATPAGGAQPAPLAPSSPDLTAAQPQGATTAQGSPAERRVGSLEDLENTFQRVAKQPAMDAEYEELIAELTRAIDAQGPESSRRKKQLESRRELLLIRRDYRDRLRAAEEAKRQLDASEIQVKNSLAEIEKSRVYTIVGTLQPSTVYDGQRLPLMYRVQSVGGISPRTLGYIKPDAKFDLDRKLGLVVGVIGTSEMDRELKLNIVTPVRVDVLRPGQAAQPVAVPGTGVQIPVTEVVTPKKD